MERQRDASMASREADGDRMVQDENDIDNDEEDVGSDGGPASA